MGGIHRHESFMEVFEITGKLREETKIQKEKYKLGKKERKIHQIEWADTRKKRH